MKKGMVKMPKAMPSMLPLSKPKTGGGKGEAVKNQMKYLKKK